MASHVRFSELTLFLLFVFFKQKTAYEMRISDWSSDVCSSDLSKVREQDRAGVQRWPPLCRQFRSGRVLRFHRPPCAATFPCRPRDRRGHGRFPASVPESLDIKHLEQWSGKHILRAWNPQGAD